MARAYSLVRRERVVSCGAAGWTVAASGCKPALALPPAPRSKWVDRYQTTDSAAHGKMGGNTPRTTTSGHVD